MIKGTIPKIHDYFFTKHSDEVLPATKQFFNQKNLGPGQNLVIHDDREHALFMEWLTFDYTMQNGRKVMENFITENPNQLSKDELQVYEDMQMNKYGLFEIKKIKMGESLDLESLHSGKIYTVLEKTGTYYATIGQSLLCRVGKIDDHWELIGSDAIALPVHYSDSIKKMFQNAKDSLSPITTREMLVQMSKSESSSNDAPMNQIQLIKKQNQIKGKLIATLKEIKSPHDLKYILDIIYKEEGQEDMSKIINILSNGKPTEIQKILDLTTKVWNHFPHKSLGNKSPQEKSDEMYDK